MAPRVPEGGFVQGRSDNIPRVDALKLMEFPKKITRNDAVNSGLPILSMLFIYRVKFSPFLTEKYFLGTTSTGYYINVCSANSTLFNPIF